MYIAKLWHITFACYLFKSQRGHSGNGSQFKAEFLQIVLDDGAVRWLTYPKLPRMNTHAERFNRISQEAFIELHKDLLLQDTKPSTTSCLITSSASTNSDPTAPSDDDPPMQLLKEANPCNRYWQDTCPWDWAS